MVRRSKWGWLWAYLAAVVVLVMGAIAPSRAASNQPATQAEIDQFWNQTLERASKIPLAPAAELVNEPNPYIKYEVTFRSLGGVPIRAYLAKPYETPGKTPRKFPAFVTAPGYLGDGMGVDLSECQRGYIILHVCPRSQGDGAQLWKIDGPDFLTWHIANPEGSYYQGAYVDVVRGIDYLCSRPDVDPDRIGAMGTSQGGGIALAVGALDPRVKAVVARVPFLCDMRRAAAIDGSLINTLLKKYNALTPENLRTLDYVDPANLVHRLQTPTLVNAGGKDTAVPAETIQALYDRLPGIKAFAFFPDATHTCPLEVYQMGWDWMERHLKRSEF